MTRSPNELLWTDKNDIQTWAVLGNPQNKHRKFMFESEVKNAEEVSESEGRRQL